SAGLSSVAPRGWTLWWHFRGWTLPLTLWQIYFSAALAMRSPDTGNCLHADSGEFHAVGKRLDALPCSGSAGDRISGTVERREIERDQCAGGQETGPHQQYSRTHAQH